MSKNHHVEHLEAADRAVFAIQGGRSRRLLDRLLDLVISGDDEVATSEPMFPWVVEEGTP